MNQKKINELMKEILKFRNHPQGGQSNYIHPQKGMYDLCCRDWAGKRLFRK